MILYRAEHLQKTAQGRLILDLDTLVFEAGKIYGLLGANGAGKTTLLNILGFLDLPTSGSMEFAGQPVRFTSTDLYRLRRQVVLVDQHPVLFSTTVYKNIEFGLKIRKIEHKQRERIIDEVLEKVGLTPFKDVPARGLSGGETQRIAIARALALSPRVLLCDEPTSSVDVENQVALLDLLRDINSADNISIILTTHDRQQAADTAHEILVLQNGALVDTAYENTFACTLLKQEGSKCVYRLNNRVDLMLPAVDAVHDLPRKKISIDPAMIELTAGAADGKAGVLQGVVVQLKADGQQVRVVVDAGVQLTVYLTRDQYGLQLPAIGDKVFLDLQKGAVS